MKKLFSKTVAAMLSITCMGSIMTTSFNGTPLFTPKLIADAEESPCVSFDEETGVLTLYGNIENMFSLANYSGDKRVKEVKALKGTVLPADCNKLFSRFEAEKIDISNADTSHVTNMSDMFSCCSNLKYLNLDNIDTSNVTNMNQTFYACPNLKSINLQSFNTSNVTDMMNMFFHCSSLETLDLSGFDTSSVTTMACMFQECTNLESVDFSSFNTRNLENMNGMFQNCTNLKSLDFSNFDTSSLKHFTCVFPYCENLEEIKFGNFNTSNVTEMDYLFYGCISLKKLDLSSFDTSNVTTMLYMFDGCQSLEKIYVSDKWTTSALDYSHPNSSSQDRFMFFNCQNVKGGNGTVYDWKTTDSKMACIDTDETPGYLTKKDPMSILNFLLGNIAKEILAPLPNIKSGNDIDNSLVTDNSSPPTNNNSNDNSKQNNSTSSDNNNSQNDNTCSNNNNANNEIYSDQDDIKTCIEKYGTHGALIGYDIPISYSDTTCYILEVCPDKTNYYDLTGPYDTAFEIYKKPFLGDYQRIEPLDNNEYKDVYYLEANKTYYIKIYPTKKIEPSGFTLHDNFKIYVHVDKVTNSSGGIWVPDKMIGKLDDNLVTLKSTVWIEYIPKEMVKDYYNDIYNMDIYKNVCNISDFIVNAGFKIADYYLEKACETKGLIIGIVIEAIIGDTSKINEWKYITENIERVSHMDENKTPQNGIVIKYVYCNDPRPAEPMYYPYFYEWDGETMKGEEGNIGRFEFLK